MSGFLIVLGNTFADLRGRYSHDWIDRSVVISILPEDLDAESALLQKLRVTVNGCVDNVAKERGEPAAIAEVRIGKQPLKLRLDRTLFLFVKGFVRRRRFRRARHRPRCGDYTPS